MPNQFVSEVKQVFVCFVCELCGSQDMHGCRCVTLTDDLENLSAVPTHVMNICVKFHRNLSTKYRDITSHKICINRRTTDGQTHDWKTLCLLSPIVGSRVRVRIQFYFILLSCSCVVCYMCCLCDFFRDGGISFLSLSYSFFLQISP